MKTIEYLDAVKASKGIASDYGIAKLFGVERAIISSYVRGRSFFDNRMCVKVADALGIDPLLVIANIERERAERAGKDDAASDWGSLIERLGGVAAAFTAAVILSGLALAPRDATAASYRASAPALPHFVADGLYIMLTNGECPRMSPR